jgi:hypothetical protein
MDQFRIVSSVFDSISHKIVGQSPKELLVDRCPAHPNCRMTP